MNFVGALAQNSTLAPTTSSSNESDWGPVAIGSAVFGGLFGLCLCCATIGCIRKCIAQSKLAELSNLNYVELDQSDLARRRAEAKEDLKSADDCIQCCGG